MKIQAVRFCLLLTLFISSFSFAHAQVSTVSFSENNTKMLVGDSRSITVNASGFVYVSTNASPNVAAANITGNIMVVQALNSGTDSITVCSSQSGSTTCGNWNVTVDKTTTATTNTTTVSPTLTFSSSNVDLVLGTTKTVTINGGTEPFSVVTNSGAASVTANISGRTVSLYGIGLGGADIKICTNPDYCGSLYAYVTQGTGAMQNASAQTGIGSTVVPTLTSLYMNSSFANGFMAAGNTVTFSFNTNTNVSAVTIAVGSSRIPVTGNNTGPFNATYTLTGNETQPLPISILLTATNGITNNLYMVLGKPGSLSSSAYSTVPPSTAPSSSPSSSASKMTITQTLDVGSTGTQVTALQEILTELGVYTGPITGKFGSLTKLAVMQFQKQHGLKQVGAVGPATRDLLNK